MKFTVLLGLLILSVSCTEKRSFSTPPVNKDLVSYSIPLDLNSENMNEELSQLANSISSGEKVSFSKISEFVLGRHSSNLGEKERQEFQSKFQTVILNLNPSSDVFQVKGSIEKSVEGKLKKSIEYNSMAVRLTNILDTAELQCSSGTEFVLNSIRAIRSGLDFRSENLVVIQESGHVLPGKMIKIGANFYLYGIESTGSGDAIVSYGDASLLSEDIHVIDAELYHITQIFRPYFKSAEAELEAAIYSLKYTADLYNIESGKSVIIDYTKRHSLRSTQIGLASAPVVTNNIQVDAVLTLLVERIGEKNVNKEDLSQFLSGYTAESLEQFKDQADSKLVDVTLNLAKSFMPTVSQLLVDILGLDISVLEKAPQAVVAQAGSTGSGPAFNSSIFSFGKPRPQSKGPRNPVGSSFSSFSQELSSLKAAYESPFAVVKVFEEPSQYSKEPGIKKIEALKSEDTVIFGLDLGTDKSFKVICNSGKSLGVVFLGEQEFDIFPLDSYSSQADQKAKDIRDQLFRQVGSERKEAFEHLLDDNCVRPF